MEFIVDGNQVNCVRVGSPPGSKKRARRTIVTFDAHLNDIAPHVKALLKPSEVAALKRWLRDRAKLHSADGGRALLHGIPELLAQAERVLRERGRVGPDLRARLGAAMASLGEALDQVEVAEAETMPDLQQMNESEALREHIDVARKKL